MLDIKRVIASKPAPPSTEPLKHLFTPWGERIMQEDVGPSTRDDAAVKEGGTTEHPRPQFAREAWTCLDGWWDFATTHTENASKAWRTATPPAAFSERIRVPFSPEAELSGVRRAIAPTELMWYRRRVRVPAREHAGDRVLLHFEAVDHACAVYVNGMRVGEHEGGYLPFCFDVTDALEVGEARERDAGTADGAPAPDRHGSGLPAAVEISVCAWDPNDTGTQPRGKQRLRHGGIWYTAQSGIWQTVWLEVVPAERIVAIDLDPQADAAVLAMTARVTGTGELTVRVLDDGIEVARCAVATDSSAHACDATPGAANPLVRGAVSANTTNEAAAATDVAATTAHTSTRTVHLKIPVPSPHLWSTEDPHLYDLELTFGRDRVRSYCAFRTVSVERDAAGTARFCINHQPVFLRGLLDQGYWPDGLMTAPADAALAHDVAIARELGFNLLRKHIKVERDRWYHHCDRAGVLVMQDMVSGGATPYSAFWSSYLPTFVKASWGAVDDESPRAHRRLGAGDASARQAWTAACQGTVEHLRNHPCIVAWCLFNEGWGQFDARAATKTVRALDPTRAIDAVSGWYDQRCGDFLSVHNYFRPLTVERDRQVEGGEPDGGVERPRPGHTSANAPDRPRASIISEFGGVSWHVAGHSSRDESYGYAQAAGRDEFTATVRSLLAQADALEQQGLAGFVYTQLSDVEDETNGLLTYDRRVVKLG